MSPASIMFAGLIIYQRLLNKKLAYGEDTVAEVADYATRIEETAQGSAVTRGVISPQKPQIQTVYTNYKNTSGNILGVEVVASYRWISKPVFLSWDDKMLLTWKDCQFTLQYAHKTSPIASIGISYGVVLLVLVTVFLICRRCRSYVGLAIRK